MRQTVGAAASGTFAAGCPAIARLPHRARKHSQQDSNLQHAVLETAALPIELREYKKPPLESNQPCLHTRAALQTALRRHIKTAPVFRRGCWLAHILSGKLHLGKDSKAFSWHGRLHVRPCGLSSPCAIRCETVDSNHAEREVRALPQTLRAAAMNGAVPKFRIEAARNVKRAKPGTCKQKRRKMLRRDTFRRLRASVCLLAFPMIQFYTMR